MLSHTHSLTSPLSHIPSTLYPLPLPQVDIYSAGVLLLEMSHPFSTGMERVVVLSNLQRRQLPKAMDDRPEGELILSMTDESPAHRPSVDALLASPLLAAHGHICVSVRLEEQYALMPLIRQQIESVVRVKSVTAHEDELLPGVRGRDASSSFDTSPLLTAKAGGGEGIVDMSSVDLVELEYFVEDHEEWDEEGRRAVERLKNGLGKLEGVLRVRGTFFACTVHASPRPSAASHPNPPAFGGNPKRQNAGGSSKSGSKNNSKSSSPLGPTGRSGGGGGGGGGGSGDGERCSRRCRLPAPPPVA